MKKLIFVLLGILFLGMQSCKKEDVLSNEFVVTYDGASFACAGQKVLLEADDIARMNHFLTYSDYTHNEIGVHKLRNSYEKGQKIIITVTKHVPNPEWICPAWIPYPSVDVIEDKLYEGIN